MPRARDGSQACQPADPLPCLCLLSLLKQLVPWATATSGGNKQCHVIVLCVEKSFLFFQFKFTRRGTGGNLWGVVFATACGAVEDPTPVGTC